MIYVVLTAVALLSAGAGATSRELLLAKCPLKGCMADCSPEQGCSTCLPEYKRALLPSGIYVCVLRGGGGSGGSTPAVPSSPEPVPSPVPLPSSPPPLVASPSPPPPKLLSPPPLASPPPPVAVASPPPAQQGGGFPSGASPAPGCPEAVDGLDLFGGDLANGILNSVSSAAACCGACRSRGTECGGYTYVPALSKCFMKGWSGWEIRPAAGKQSAVMPTDSSSPASPLPSQPAPPVAVTPSPSPSPKPSPSPPPPKASPPPPKASPPPPKASPPPPKASPPPPKASPPPPRASPPPPVVVPSPSPAVGPPGGATVYTGDATAFSDAVAGTGKDFACAYPWLSQWQSTYFAAINIGQWDSGRQCGRCAMARCVDNRCKVKNKWVQVYLVDQCPTCPGRDLDFSNPSFRELTGLSPDRVKIEWYFTSCANRITGGIRLSPKESSVNEYWQAIFLHNSAEPISAVTIDGKPLKLETYGFWVNSGYLKNGVQHVLTLTSRGGNKLSTTVTSVWRAQELPIQFPGGVA